MAEAFTRYGSKRARLQAVARVWRDVHGRDSFTIEELVSWLMHEGLYPVPKRGDPRRICDKWDRMLNQWARAARSTVLSELASVDERLHAVGEAVGELERRLSDAREDLRDARERGKGNGGR